MVHHLDNMYCAAIRRGDVVLCTENNKEKLYVVIQDDVLNQSLPTMVCVPIEEYKKGDKILINEVLLKKGETGLGKDGVCFLHKIMIVERVHVIAKKAELNKERVDELLGALDITLGRFRDK